MNKQEMLDKIAEMLRNTYPDAVSVNVFVNYEEVDVEASYRRKTVGISMQTLSGGWIK